MDNNRILWNSAAIGDFSAVASAIKAGADVNYADKDGRTALIRAAKRGYYNIVSLMIDNKADVNAKDSGDKCKN